VVKVFTGITVYDMSPSPVTSPVSAVFNDIPHPSGTPQVKVEGVKSCERGGYPTFILSIDVVGFHRGSF
jgi:hypothetical protein